MAFSLIQCYQIKQETNNKYKFKKMKKIALITALLGAIFTMNAQVGIGTPDPATSAELDIVSKTRGILIPRVELTDIKNFKPIDGTEEESLLVFNITDNGNISKGFYYWANNQWNLIVNKEELTKTIELLKGDVTNLNGDIENIQKVINYIVPSNPDNKDEKQELHSAVVFNKETKEFTQVGYDLENKKYSATQIDFDDLVADSETQTFIRLIGNEGEAKKYAFFSESTIQNWLDKDEKNTVDNIQNDVEGVVVIDVIGDITHNMNEFLSSNTNVKIEGSEEFYTVEELIKNLSSKVDGNVIYKNTGDGSNAKWEFQFYDGKEYKTIDLNEIIASTETSTKIVPVAEDGKIVGYKYFNEEDVKAFLKDNPGKTVNDIDSNVAGGVEMNVVSDVISNITTILNSNVTDNFTVLDLIAKHISKGGTVYFGDHDGKSDTAEVFYQIDEKGEKTPIDVKFLENYISDNLFNIKKILGDHITNDNSVIFTGDTIYGYDVYKFSGTTTIKAHSARTSGISIPSEAKIHSIISIQVLLEDQLITTSTTDVKVEEGKLNFNIGTGNQYNIIGAGTYNVIVEYTATK